MIRGVGVQGKECETLLEDLHPNKRRPVLSPPVNAPVTALRCINPQTALAAVNLGTSHAHVLLSTSYCGHFQPSIVDATELTSEARGMKLLNGQFINTLKLQPT